MDPLADGAHAEHVVNHLVEGHSVELASWCPYRFAVVGDVNRDRGWCVGLGGKGAFGRHRTLHRWKRRLPRCEPGPSQVVLDDVGVEAGPRLPVPRGSALLCLIGGPHFSEGLGP